MSFPKLKVKQEWQVLVFDTFSDSEIFKIGCSTEKEANKSLTTFLEMEGETEDYEKSVTLVRESFDSKDVREWAKSAANDLRCINCVHPKNLCRNVQKATEEHICMKCNCSNCKAYRELSRVAEGEMK